jgi:predicted PurR-regulated permease PerM
LILVFVVVFCCLLLFFVVVFFSISTSPTTCAPNHFSSQGAPLLHHRTIAIEVLPFLLPLSMHPDLTAAQHKIFGKIVSDMVQAVLASRQAEITRSTSVGGCVFCFCFFYCLFFLTKKKKKKKN